MKKGNIQTCISWGITAFLVIACSIIFYFCFDRIIGLRTFFRNVVNMLMPIIWGIVIAYLLAPIYNVLHRNLYPMCQKKLSEKQSLHCSGFLSIAASILLAMLMIYALFAMIVPQLITSIQNIINRAPLYVVEVRQWLRNLLEDYPAIQESVLSAYNTLSNKAMDWVNNNLDIRNMDSTSLQTLLPNVWNVVSSVSAGLVKVITFLKNVIIGFIVAIYLLAMKKLLCGQMKRMVYAVCSKKVANIVIEHCRYAHKVMSGFISGKVLDSVIIGLICFAGTSILRIPYALLVSVIIGLTNIIPFFGPFIGAVPCALFILLNSPVKCLVFIVFIVLLQQFDGNILGPKILGESTGLSSFWVIFALLLFGGLFGVVGMLIGVPIFAVFYHIVDDATRALLRKKGMSVDTKDYILLERVEGDQYIKLKDPAFRDDAGSNRRDPEPPPADEKTSDEGGETED